MATRTPHQLRNFISLVTSTVAFRVASTFVSLEIVIPMLVERLTGSASLVGIANALCYGSWLLPQMVAGRTMQEKPRKYPYLVGGALGRIFYWPIVLALWAGMARRPLLMVAILLICFAIYRASDGVTAVAYFDIVGRAFLGKVRSRFMAAITIVGGVLGLAAAVWAERILADPRLRFPQQFVLLFALAGAAQLFSLAGLSSVREPPPASAVEDEAVPTVTDEVGCNPGAGAARDWGVRAVLGDKRFRRLVTCRLLVGLVTMSVPFYVVHASRVLELPESVVGRFVLMQTVAMLVVGLLMSAVNEWWGALSVVRLGAVGGLAGPSLALVAHLTKLPPLIAIYGLVYVAYAFLSGSLMLGYWDHLLEIAPARAGGLYAGTYNTITALLMLAPVAGGWLLEITSYTVLFALTLAGMVVGCIVAFSLKRGDAAPA